MFLQRRFWTLIIASIILGCTWWAYTRFLIIDESMFNNDGYYRLLVGFLIPSAIGCMLIASLLALCHTLRQAGVKLEFGAVNWLRLPIGGRGLVVMVVLLMVVLGVMMACSGGAVNSGFSHYLGATGAVSLTLARRSYTKIAILAATCVVYILAAQWFYAPAVRHELFNQSCFVVATVLAAVAGWSNTVTDDESEK